MLLLWKDGDLIMDIGKRIIELREKKGWSQRELARRANLNPSVMNRIETGDRPLRAEELKIIASLLDVTADYILGESKSPSLSAKDERDIAKRMEKMKKDLLRGSANGEGLSFMGEPMSPEAIDSLLEALEHAERIATIANKKYTPKKYRDKE